MTPATEFTANVEALTKEVTPKVRGMARSIAIDPSLNEGVLAMMERSSEMRSPMTALLAGIAAVPSARKLWEATLDELWAANRAPTSKIVDEVVVGSGYHASIYCAMRAQMGQPVPVVLEAESRVGGVFAVSRSGSFFLNSRNRPGGLSIPRQQGALNFLPGSPIQPADVSGEEYQVNADLAFAIRSIFALTGAKVVTDARVNNVYPTYRFPRYGSASYGRGRESYVELTLNDGRTIKAKRVIIATGIGRPRNQWGTQAGDRLLSFKGFMGRFDSHFPLRGMKRVAVIGAGDSGKTVIEALTGQGPANHMSVPSLDYLSDVVWFGQEQTNRTDFEGCNRPRYKRIGTLLDQTPNRPRRVQTRSRKVTYVTQGYDCVLVDGEPFDYAIDCTGYVPQAVGRDEPRDLETFEDLARKGPRGSSDYLDRIFYVGPSARLDRTEQERLATPDTPNARANREAEVAAYRYAGRTAMLAQRLDVL